MRSGLGLPERRLKMLMKIRSARLYFLGNTIYFSCTTVSPTPVFQVLGHGQLRVSVLGLACPWSDLLSLGCAMPAGRTLDLRNGSGEKLLGTELWVPWCGSVWSSLGQTPAPPFPALGTSLVPQNPTTSGPAQPMGGQRQKLLFLSKQPEEGPVPRQRLRGAQEIYR